MSRDQHNGHRHITRCPAPSAVISMTEARWVTGEQHPVIGHFHVDTAIVKAKSGFGPVRYLWLLNSDQLSHSHRYLSHPQQTCITPAISGTLLKIWFSEWREREEVEKLCWPHLELSSHLLKTGLWKAKVLLGKTWQAAQGVKIICCDPALWQLNQY